MSTGLKLPGRLPTLQLILFRLRPMLQPGQPLKLLQETQRWSMTTLVFPAVADMSEFMEPPGLQYMVIQSLNWKSMLPPAAHLRAVVRPQAAAHLPAQAVLRVEELARLLNMLQELLMQTVLSFKTAEFHIPAQLADGVLQLRHGHMLREPGQHGLWHGHRTGLVQKVLTNQINL